MRPDTTVGRISARRRSIGSKAGARRPSAAGTGAVGAAGTVAGGAAVIVAAGATAAVAVLVVRSSRMPTDIPYTYP